MPETPEKKNPYKKILYICGVIAGLAGGIEGYITIEKHAKASAKEFVAVEAQKAVEKYIATKLVGFKSDLAKKRGIDIENVDEWVYEDLRYVDTLRSNRRFQAMVKFSYEYMPVGLYVKMGNNSTWYRSADKELYRAHRIDTGRWAGYYMYVDQRGKSKYIWEN